MGVVTRRAGPSGHEVGETGCQLTGVPTTSGETSGGRAKLGDRPATRFGWARPASGLPEWRFRLPPRGAENSPPYGPVHREFVGNVEDSCLDGQSRRIHDAKWAFFSNDHIGERQC